jgi:hypothetical protein
MSEFGIIFVALGALLLFGAMFGGTAGASGITNDLRFWMAYYTPNMQYTYYIANMTDAYTGDCAFVPNVTGNFLEISDGFEPGKLFTVKTPAGTKSFATNRAIYSLDRNSYLVYYKSVEGSDGQPGYACYIEIPYAGQAVGYAPSNNAWAPKEIRPVLGAKRYGNVPEGAVSFTESNGTKKDAWTMPWITQIGNGGGVQAWFNNELDGNSSAREIIYQADNGAAQYVQEQFVGRSCTKIAIIGQAEVAQGREFYLPADGCSP